MTGSEHRTLARPAGPQPAASLWTSPPLNLDDQAIVILGKGDRPGAIPFGRNTEVR